jgi:hypothetical protein
VEFFDREFVAERFFGFVTEFKDTELADHVGASLALPDDVALRFLGGDAVIEDLLAGPFFGVESGVHDVAAGGNLELKNSGKLESAKSPSQFPEFVSSEFFNQPERQRAISVLV